MKDREIQCKWYKYEGCCEKGREGSFRRSCQKCSLYSPLKGAKPARRNLKKEKKEKFLKDRRNWE